MTTTDNRNHDNMISAVATLKTVLSPSKSENPLRKAGPFVLNG